MVTRNFSFLCSFLMISHILVIIRASQINDSGDVSSILPSGKKMPRFSWNTLPVAFHSSNVTAPTGMYNSESLKTLARYSMVTIEKWQGINGLFPDDSFNWQNCQNGTDVTHCGCCTEDNIVAVGNWIITSLTPRVVYQPAV